MSQEPVNSNHQPEALNPKNRTCLHLLPEASKQEPSTSNLPPPTASQPSPIAPNAGKKKGREGKNKEGTR